MGRAATKTSNHKPQALTNFHNIMVKKHERRSHLKPEQKLEGGVFDVQTLVALRKLMKTGFIDKLDGPIATGKEADVFLARLKDEPRVVKIFRIETTSFKNILPYIQGDPRFRIRRKRHEIVFEWAKKEFRNLERAHYAGLKVPKPYKVMRNILIMSLIGTDSTPAPQLNTIPTGEIKNPKKLAKDLLEFLKQLHKKAGLVHADFSEFNILMKSAGEPYVVDFAQAVLTDSRNAKDFLGRDVENYIRYFAKYKLDFDKEKVLKEIIGENH